MHQSVYELVHTDDQQELRKNLHWALNPSPAGSTSMSEDSPNGEHFLVIKVYVVDSREHAYMNAFVDFGNKYMKFAYLFSLIFRHDFNYNTGVPQGTVLFPF